jgi:cytochrome c biogenesis protein CcmG, thiol:disulfide interchange protein DsbE
MGKWLLFLPPILFAGLAAMFWVGMHREGRDDLPSTLEGRAAPVVQVQPLGPGPSLTQGDLTAPGVKLVNFWASWCAPCRVEHPNLQALADEGVVIHGVNYKDQPDKALGFLAELGNPFATLGADATGRMGLDWGLYGVPETFVIDADGKVVLRFPGPITQSVLDETIRPAIAAASAP